MEKWNVKKVKIVMFDNRPDIPDWESGGLGLVVRNIRTTRNRHYTRISYQHLPRRLLLKMFRKVPPSDYFATPHPNISVTPPSSSTDG